MDVRVGRLEDLPPEEPYPGVRRRSFDGEGATVTEYRMAPGARFPLHRHAQEQLTLVQEGEVEMTVAGQAVQLGPGAWSVVAADVEHAIANGDRPARFLAIVVPRRPDAMAYTVVGD